MVKWILGNSSLKTILEPAFGLGLFSRVCYCPTKKIWKIKGFEIDKTISDYAKRHFSDVHNIELLLEELLSDWKQKYDGIICNPPYFKFHDFDNKNIIKRN